MFTLSSDDGFGTASCDSKSDYNHFEFSIEALKEKEDECKLCFIV